MWKGRKNVLEGGKKVQKYVEVGVGEVERNSGL